MNVCAHGRERERNQRFILASGERNEEKKKKEKGGEWRSSWESIRIAWLTLFLGRVLIVNIIAPYQVILSTGHCT